MKKILGLTLIEVLIALVIIAIALTAIVKATSEDVENATYLQNKTMATWVADNAVAAIQLNIVNPPFIGQVTEMLGRQWYWDAEVNVVTPYVAKITVNVREKPQGKLIVSLQGFKTVE